MLDVEIAYGTCTKQKLYRLSVQHGTTARQAVLQIDLLADFPDANVHAPLGIFGKAVADDCLLKNGDRVEIYRPLLIDPKQARRDRVAKKKEFK